MKRAKLTFKLESPKVLAVMAFVLLGLIGTVFIAGVKLSDRWRQIYQEKQLQDFAAPEKAVKRQIKKVTLKRETDEGTEYVEILANGQINLYDANMKLKKTGLQGFTNLNILFDKIEGKLDQIAGLKGIVGGKGNYTLTIETNQGTIVVIVTPGDGDDGDVVDEIIDDVEDTTDHTLNPTPTIRQPTPTRAPGLPSSTPRPSTSPPVVSPTRIISVGPGTPTPLPEYMTAPPFSCQDYKHTQRPFAISGVICGTE